MKHPDHKLKNSGAALMALAMAGIAAPSAHGTAYIESTDYSDNGASPTSLGPFNPATDSIQGVITSGDSDCLFVTATPGAVVIPFSIVGAAFPGFQIAIYDNANFSGILNADGADSASGTASGSISFTVPADGNYMIYMNKESGGSTSYTLGTPAPEPTTSALALAGLAGVAALRRRKQSAPSP